MAPFMVSLRKQKAGGHLARKVIPKDVRDDYAALYGIAWEEKLSAGEETSIDLGDLLFGPGKDDESGEETNGGRGGRLRLFARALGRFARRLPLIGSLSRAARRD